MANTILKYSSKDYESIKKDLIDAISALTTTWTSREDGDPGIVLVKLMAALGDMESFNLDKQALEYYAPTVTQRKNASRLFNLIGYKMHWYRTAKTTITATYRYPFVNGDYEWLDIYQKVVNGDGDITELYAQYIAKYAGMFGTTFVYCTFPPALNNTTSVGMMPDQPVPVPQSFFDKYEDTYGHNRPWFICSQDFNPDGTVNMDSQYLYGHAQAFAEMAKIMFECWTEDNKIGLHQCLTDPQLALGVYGDDYNSIQYSLIPTTVGAVHNGVYEPTTYIYPYTPTELSVIQGSLRSITFTANQIKNNRYYVPDAELDEDYMYLSYIVSNDDGVTQERPIFIEKTDNILTVTNFKSDVETTKTYFEFNVDEFDYPYIELSSYWKDVISEDSVTFTFYYFKTAGANGCITDDYLTNMTSEAGKNMVISNLANSHYVVDDSGNYLCEPGYNPQTAYEAYVDSINYIMTFDTVTTIYDFTRFTRRQKGVSNAFACDGQYARDLNKKIREVCDSYTIEQLRNILGGPYKKIEPQVNSTLFNTYADSDASSDDVSALSDTALQEVNASLNTNTYQYTQEELADILYNIRKITFSPKDASIDGTPVEEQAFINYAINLYPIWENYETARPYDTNMKFAFYGNTVDGSTTVFPYQLYGVYTEDDITGYSDRCADIATEITKALRETRIVNTVAHYAPCRVFPWQCCGTLHLNQMVTPQEANNIIKNVVDYLNKRYAPQNMQFGQKVTYMELIDSILQADSRIRYFDAGMGDRKMIDFIGTGANGMNVEAYFNPISIMRYTQTYDDIVGADKGDDVKNMICVDPSYIQTTGLIQ